MRTALVVLGTFQIAGCWLLYRLFLRHGRLLLQLEALERPFGGSEDRGGNIEKSAHTSVGPTTSLADVSGLPPHSVLADFSLDPLTSSGAGRTMTLSQHRGQQMLLVFVNPDCVFSRDLLAEWSSALGSSAQSTPTPLVISLGDITEARRLFEQYPPPCPVLVDPESTLSSLYRIRATPSAYLVDEYGATSSEMLTGGPDVLSALRGSRIDSPQRENSRAHSPSIVSSRLVRDGLKKGTPAPAFSLSDLNGRTISLSDYLGKQILLVFSDPECRPCQTLLPELERLHQQSADPVVVMISRGGLEVNRAKAAQNHVSFPIALQRHWEISRAYGMFATPIGYLIDRRGRLASDVAVGVDAILRLVSNDVRLDKRAPAGAAR